MNKCPMSELLAYGPIPTSTGGTPSDDSNFHIKDSAHIEHPHNRELERVERVCRAERQSASIEPFWSHFYGVQTGRIACATICIWASALQIVGDRKLHWYTRWPTFVSAWANSITTFGVLRKTGLRRFVLYIDRSSHHAYIKENFGIFLSSWMPSRMGTFWGLGEIGPQFAHSVTKAQTTPTWHCSSNRPSPFRIPPPPSCLLLPTRNGLRARASPSREESNHTRLKKAHRISGFPFEIPGHKSEPRAKLHLPDFND